jgi:uncharacterized delta-60 repeat protein
MRQKNKQRLFTELQLLENRRLLTTASVDSSHVLNIAGSGSGDTIFVNRKSNGKVSVTGVGTQFTMGSGSGQFNKISITGGGGSDNISISSNVTYLSATIAGGTGNDTIGGGVGNDLLSGNDGNDRLDGASAGGDTLTGGGGLDTSNYSSRTDALKITLDGTSNDGGSNGAEGDNVQTEEVLGGSGNDTITGSAGDDYLSGGAGADSITGNGGNDVITGSTGSDKMYGNAGDDFLQAQNQDADVVNGGTNPGNTPDLDLASIDDIDTPNFAKGGGNAGPGFSPSDVDPNFGDNGKVTGPMLGWDYINASTMDSQGRIIFVGGAYYDSEDFVAARYNADGTFDYTFGNEGVAHVDFTPDGNEGYADDDVAYGVTVDADDNIIIVGSSYPISDGRYDPDFAIVKLLEEFGAPDPEYGDEGRVRIDSLENFASDAAADVVVQRDGKIVVAGYYEYGGMVSSFTEEGSDFDVLRLTPEGDLDPTFNEGSPLLIDIGMYDFANSLALQNFASDEGAQRIVISGTSDDDFSLARLTANGSIDGSFGDEGTAVRDFGAYESLADIAVNDSNQVYAVGSTDDRQLDVVDAVAGVLARFDADGQFVDLRIESRGEYLTYNAVAIDNEGRILVGGENGEDFVIGRYNDSDLKLDKTFADDLVYTDFTDPEDEGLDLDYAFGVFVREDGRIIETGVNDFNGDGGIQNAMVMFQGGDARDDGELAVDEIERIVDDEDVFGNPPDPEVKKHLDALSSTGKFYVLGQPKDDGSVDLPLTDGNDVVRFFTVEDGEGNEVLGVDVNGVVLYYRQDGGLPPGFAPGGDVATLLRFDLKKGNDQILGNSNVLIPLEIYCGDGNDSVVGGDVSDVIFGQAGNDSIESQNGNDIVVGGDGNDFIRGSGNRDIVIGGKGKDDLSGGSSDDILIAGNTSHDSNLSSLQALLAEWTSSNDYTTRINNLRNGGGANGSVKLVTSGSGQNVFNDNSKDSLKGADGRDWFIRSTSTASDVLADRASDETITTV